MPELAAATYNPMTPAFRADPHPQLHQLRAADPVHRSSFMGVWILTRYADVDAALRQEAFSADARWWSEYERFYVRPDAGGLNPAAEAFRGWMLQTDPPDHTRLRGLVNRAFTPGVCRSIRPRIQAAIDRLLEPHLARGEMDLIDDLAYPLPILVICDLLGVPNADFESIKRWSHDLLPGFSPALSIAKSRQVGDAASKLRGYFADLVAQRRRVPTDDLISGLIAAREDSDRLSEEELLSMCMLLVFAGHLSTVQLIGGGLLALLDNPDQADRLRADPAMMDSAVEEALRYVTPLQVAYRTTRTVTAVADVTIPAGEMVLLSLAAANRDPAQFVEPDCFDIGRSPNRHVGFGYGMHYCAGAALARLEAKLAFEAVLRRCPGLRQAGEITRESSLMLRGLERLPVSFRASA